MTPEEIKAMLDEFKKQINEDLKTSFNVIKKDLNDAIKNHANKEDIENVKTAFATDIAKTNEAVNKIALETETKIKQLSETIPAIKKAWYDKELF